MIPRVVIAEIARLLSEGTHTQTEIARWTRVSRQIVHDVKLGKRPVRSVRSVRSAPTNDEQPTFEVEGSVDDLALDLREDHEERYDEVKHSNIQN